MQHGNMQSNSCRTRLYIQSGMSHLRIDRACLRAGRAVALDRKMECESHESMQGEMLCYAMLCDAMRCDAMMQCNAMMQWNAISTRTCSRFAALTLAASLGPAVVYSDTVTISVSIQ
jgi:hypothetical protein